MKAVALITAMLITSACSTGRLHTEEELSRAISSLPSTDLSTTDFAVARMIENGIDSSFAKMMEKQFTSDKKNSEFRDQIVQLNVLGFLSPGDYSKHYSESAVRNVKKFIKKYGKTLSRAENEFNVPKEVIASLLWVETKHGKNMGKFPLPMVYFSLLQATHPEVAKKTLSELSTRAPASTSEVRQKVIQRLEKKSQWALEQIKSLEQISKKHASSKTSIFKIRSSFAGAFGCSQFIPSSFEKYAVSATKGTPNLFDLKDCIFSVANYLHQKGWDSGNPQSQSDALFDYNRIRDYGDVIQKLAKSSTSDT